MVVEQKLVPPLNFAMVSPGVYRSGYPNKKNFPFLKKLGLKSLMYRYDSHGQSNRKGVSRATISLQRMPNSVSKKG